MDPDVTIVAAMSGVIGTLGGSLAWLVKQVLDAFKKNTEGFYHLSETMKSIRDTNATDHTRIEGRFDKLSDKLDGKL